MLLLDSTLLGDSQTFLGVLATLLVLCLFYEGRRRSHKTPIPDENANPETGDEEVGGNNFLFRILHSEKERIKEKISEIEKKFADLGDSLSVSEIYEKIRIISGNENADQNVKNRAGLFLSKYSRIQSKLKITTVADQFKLMSTIETDNEQFRAPLFSFALSILAFCLDEFWILCPNWHDVISVFLGVMTLISTIYWTLIWIASCFSDEKYKNWKLRKGFDMMPDNLEASLSGLIFLLVFGLLCFGLINLYPLQWYLDVNLVLAIVFAPITIFGVFKLITSRMRGNYSYSHIIGHFFALMIYSGLLTTLIFYGNDIRVRVIFESSFLVKPKLVTVLSVGFILLNGLLVPFLLPLFRYRYILVNNILTLRWVAIRIRYVGWRMRKQGKDILADYASSILGKS